ncbi:hypothetical protein VA603_08615 [Stenotrophomonas sp. MH1]|uniref:Transmembrane protein n=1 Tax=Stenotrophomonas capsici TaxID=3110230 RepID=A0ABU5V2K3_9GAMM|nr:hypothetical protein [Stenotrophomonas sp. MH1]MEA5667588.1 hypothetical protein [Stenotrophomonas sp. MH1]
MEAAPRSANPSYRFGLAALLMPLVSLLVGSIAVAVIHGGLEELAAMLIIGIGGCVMGCLLALVSRWRRESNAWLGYTALFFNGLPLLGLLAASL